MSSLVDIPEILALAITLAAAMPTAAEQDGVLSLSGSNSKMAVMALGAHDRAAIRYGFQFQQQGWLRAVKQAGRNPRFAHIASRIFKTSTGRYYVPIEVERAGIVALRGHGETAFQVTQAQALYNRRVLAQKLRQVINPIDLYVAHRFGTQTAMQLRKLVNSSPRAVVAAKFPQIAFAEPTLFFGAKRGRSIKTIYRLLGRAFAKAASTAARKWSKYKRQHLAKNSYPPASLATKVKHRSRRARITQSHQSHQSHHGTASRSSLRGTQSKAIQFPAGHVRAAMSWTMQVQRTY